MEMEMMKYMFVDDTNAKIETCRAKIEELKKNGVNAYDSKWDEAFQYIFLNLRTALDIYFSGIENTYHIVKENPDGKQPNLFDKMRAAEGFEIFDADQIENMHEIRKIGNDFAHPERKQEIPDVDRISEMLEKFSDSVENADFAPLEAYSKKAHLIKELQWKIKPEFPERYLKFKNFFGNFSDFILSNQCEQFMPDKNRKYIYKSFVDIKEPEEFDGKMLEYAEKRLIEIGNPNITESKESGYILQSGYHRLKKETEFDPALLEMLREFANQKIAAVVIITHTFEPEILERFLMFAHCLKCCRTSFLIEGEVFDPQQMRKVAGKMWTEDTSLLGEKNEIFGISFEWNHRAPEDQKNLDDMIENVKESIYHDNLFQSEETSYFDEKEMEYYLKDILQQNTLYDYSKWEIDYIQSEIIETPVIENRIDFSDFSTNNSRNAFESTEATSPYEIFIRTTEDEEENARIFGIAEKRIAETGKDVSMIQNHIVQENYGIGSQYSFTLSSMPKLQEMLKAFLNRKTASLIVVFPSDDVVLNENYFHESSSYVSSGFSVYFDEDCLMKDLIDFARAVKCWKTSFLVEYRSFSIKTADFERKTVWTDDIETVEKYRNILGINFEWEVKEGENK